MRGCYPSCKKPDSSSAYSAYLDFANPYYSRINRGKITRCKDHVIIGIYQAISN
jgi:hypothetical protein